MATQAPTLFEPVRPAPAHGPSHGIVLRDYQAEDADEVCRLWKSGTRQVLCVHATGLGKSHIAAELAARKPAGSQAMICVDSTDLALDLARTVKLHTGKKPGVFMGEFKENWQDADILVCTKQCLCYADQYRSLDLSRLSTCIIDECESGLANEYLLMLDYFLTQVPGLKLCGLTATPLPAGNRKITDLFSHAATEPGPLYRDLQWAYLNGWLVKPMQGVLRCSLDFASLKIRRQENGEKDFSDRDIARLMLQQEEREWLELAGGIYQIAQGHTAIVVCPNKTVVADRLAGYIEGHARARGERNIAFSVHRSLGRTSYDLMRRFKRGEFPICVSCRLFERGFDYDRVNMVIMLRRTRSLRLYTQVAGRSTRPLFGIRQRLSETADPKERMQIIAQSDKPHAVIVDCVGINDDAKNILGVIDILGRGVRDDVKERVRRMMLDRARAALEFDAFAEPTEPPGRDVGDDARAAVKEIRDEYESARSRLSGEVDVSYSVGESTRGRKVKPQKIVRGDSTIKQVKMLIALGMIPNYALALSKRQAQGAIGKCMKANKKPDWQLVRNWERANNVFGG